MTQPPNIREVDWIKCKDKLPPMFEVVMVVGSRNGRFIECEARRWSGWNGDLREKSFQWLTNEDRNLTDVSRWKPLTESMDIFIPLHDIMIRADVPEGEINITRYSKTMIDDLKTLVAKYGLDIHKVHNVENLADNDVVIYRQRLK